MENYLFDLKQTFLHNSEQFYEKFSKETYENLTLTEVHCLDKIENSNKPNVTNIALNMNITKGAITKISTKLLRKKYIVKYNIEGNRKEVYFKLTDSGKRIFDKHETRHKKLEEDEKDFLKSFSKEEQQVIIEFFEKYNTYVLSKIKAIKE